MAACRYQYSPFLDKFLLKFSGFDNKLTTYSCVYYWVKCDAMIYEYNV